MKSLAGIVAVAALVPLSSDSLRAQPAASGTRAAARFDVASVKPCRDDLPFDTRTGGGITSPETPEIRCQTLKGLIQMAYVAFAGGVRVTPNRITIEGGPKWIDTERFDLQAKAVGVTSQTAMHGPMLQTLLEDRFQLKIRRETRQIPVYALTVAKGGPKLTRFKEGTCNPYDIAATFPPPPPPDNPCHNSGGMTNGVLVIDIPATTLDDFARFQLGVLDRPVVNKTGLAGLFNFHLEYTPDDSSSASRQGAQATANPPGPSIFSAVQKLGLKLDAAKGPGEFLVIDSASKPSEN